MPLKWTVLFKNDAAEDVVADDVQIGVSGDLFFLVVLPEDGHVIKRAFAAGVWQEFWLIKMDGKEVPK